MAIVLKLSTTLIKIFAIFGGGPYYFNNESGTSVSKDPINKEMVNFCEVSLTALVASHLTAASVHQLVATWKIYLSLIYDLLLAPGAFMFNFSFLHRRIL